MSTMFSSTTARHSGRTSNATSGTSNATSVHCNREGTPTHVHLVYSTSPIIIDSPSPTPTHTASVPSPLLEVQIIDVGAMPSNPTDFDALDLEPAPTPVVTGPAPFPMTVTTGNSTVATNTAGSTNLVVSLRPAAPTPRSVVFAIRVECTNWPN
jgi:hypothetical protein